MSGNSKIDSFKEFIKNNSFLISYVKDGKRTWQDMYEIYDLYGEDEDAWAKFLENGNDKKEVNNKNNYFEELVRMAKSIDVNKVQEGITSLQKTLGLFGDLFAGKGNENVNSREYNPRPLYRRFED